jgi:hypothetical protein
VRSQPRLIVKPSEDSFRRRRDMDHSLEGAPHGPASSMALQDPPQQLLVLAFGAGGGSGSDFPAQQQPDASRASPAGSVSAAGSLAGNP